MTDQVLIAAGSLPGAPPADRFAHMQARLKVRQAQEARFKLYGRAAIVVALSFLVILLGRIVLQGYTTFIDYQVSVPVLSRSGAHRPRRSVGGANFDMLVAEAVLGKLGEVDDDGGRASGKVMDAHVQRPRLPAAETWCAPTRT
jgi:phosphate transport system permease protein